MSYRYPKPEVIYLFHHNIKRHIVRTKDRQSAKNDGSFIIPSSIIPDRREPTTRIIHPFCVCENHPHYFFELRRRRRTSSFCSHTGQARQPTRLCVCATVIIMGTVSTKASVPEGLSAMQIAEIDYKAVMQSSGGMQYCKHPHEVWEMCMMSADESVSTPLSQCAEYAKDASACATVIMMQTTLLACADEMETCRAAAADIDAATYQQEIDRRLVPCVKRNLANKEYPDAVYPGGSKSAVQGAVSAIKKLDEKKNNLLDSVGPLLRSDYDKATASFRGGSAK